MFFLGTLSHFFYNLSDNNSIVGLFTPVNESTWEHMKLIFFPMLLYSLFMIPKFQKSYPCITSALASGILLGTLLIPVIFYTYTGILGRNLLALDIGTFILSVFFAFYSAYYLTLNCRMQKHMFLIYTALCLFAISFLVFSYYPPDIGLFSTPVVSGRATD